MRCTDIFEPRTLLENSPRTLYHGTIRRLVPSIMAIGLVPDVGEFTRRAYDESEAAGIDLPDLVFAADRNGLGSCVSAILGAMEQAGIADTPHNFFQHGAIVVLKHAADDFEHRDEDDENYWGEYPETVEPGDYYREYGIKPDFAIMGDRLRVFLRRHNITLNRFGRMDRKAAQTQLISLTIRQHPNQDQQELINQIRALSDQQIAAQLGKFRHAL